MNKTKYQMVSALLKRLNASDVDEVTSIYEQVFTDSEITEEADGIEISTEVSNLFEGAEITEELKTQTVAIFEAAVGERVATEVATLEESITSATDAALTDLKEEHEANINKYLTYVAENWVKDNELVIENGIKLDIAESFIGGLKQLFVEHNVNITEEESEVAETLSNKVAELETKLNEEVAEKLTLKEEILSKEFDVIFKEVSEGLADTEVEKLEKLMEGIEAKDTDTYRSKIEIIKESYFPVSATVAKLTEETVDDKGGDTASSTSIYVQHISNAVKNI